MIVPATMPAVRPRRASAEGVVATAVAATSDKANPACMSFFIMLRPFLSRPCAVSRRPPKVHLGEAPASLADH
jgi:hypothetical protein